MAASTMAQLHRRPTEHTGWCARDHRCGLNVHTSPDMYTDGPLGARGVLNRVHTETSDYAEIRIRIPINARESIARKQLGVALHLIRELLYAVAAVRPPALDHARNQRPALDRRPAA
ncbi:hypothetical protein [Paractinoplanes rishiriensis]|uniref:Uncharacterized protein n=1 Tax=Paractinoplanes rishiriensis TaxID=1050105 RepID=A0A919KBI0_9ACTN|nr:hypothetical protein [Actinoplanes rishiriensis]GIF02343.1 hypothetical protein Ari01nite_98070 [Actinoplanes rishiriensis]